MNGHTQYGSTTTAQSSSKSQENWQVGNDVCDVEGLLEGDPTLIDPDAGVEDPTPHFKYTAENQTHLTAALLHDPELLEVAIGLGINPRSFTEKAHRLLVGAAMEYYSQYEALPPRAFYRQQIVNQISEKKARVYYEATLNALSYESIFYPPDYWKNMLGKFAKIANFHYSVHKFSQGAEKGIDVDELHQQYCERYERLNAVCVSDEQLESLDAIEFLDFAEEFKTEWVLDNWIAEGCLHLWVGAKKLGKTSTLTSLIPSLMSGNRWHEEIAVKQCPVIVVDFENPQNYIADNLLTYATREQLGEHRGNLCIPKENPKSLSKEFLTALIEKRYPDQKTGVVVIDAAVAAFGARFGHISDWDNKASEVRKVLHELLAVARTTNWAIVLVHHANKQGDTGGTVHWEAAVDFVLSFERAKGDRQLVAKWGRWVKSKPDRLVFRKVGDTIQLIDAREETSRQNGDQQQDDIDLVLAAIPALGIDEQPTEQNTVTFEFIKDQTGLGRNKLTELLDQLRGGQIIGRERDKVTSPYGFFRYRWA